MMPRWRHEAWEALIDCIDTIPWWMRLLAVAGIALVFAGMLGLVNLLG